MSKVELVNPLGHFNLVEDGRVIFTFADNGQTVEMTITETDGLAQHSNAFAIAHEALQYYTNEGKDAAFEYLQQYMIEDDELTDDDIFQLLDEDNDE